MKNGISIIICTYNGKDRLSDTLLHIANQQLNIPCEVIFVDNASNDGTRNFADEWWKNNGNPKINYSSFQQPIPGKSYAQDLGYEKAHYEYLLVCDDDNWLCEKYVQTAFNIMESHEEIGALGGWCEAEFEGEKPNWFDQYAKYFAVSKQGSANGDITDKKGCLYGAGMVIRKSHWLQLKELGFEHLLSCRKGNSLSSGGDTEYSYALRLLDYKIWYDERLYFKHFMTKGRMNLNYLSNLRKAMTYSNSILWSYLDILKPSERSYKQIFAKGLKGVFKEWAKFIKQLLVDDFEEREIAKEYFRNFYYLVFNTPTYKKNKQFIKSWLIKKGL